MRIAPIPPCALTDEQRVLDERVRGLLGGLIAPFTVVDEQEALIGPFPVMLRFPGLAAPLIDWFVDVHRAGVLSARVREIAILTVGARYGAAYELYSHDRVARAVGLSESQVAALSAGRCPAGLDDAEQLAHDVASRLLAGAPLPGALYRSAHAAYGGTGIAELVFLVAQYTTICMILNAYDVALPPDAD